jgi:hypothetical protein
MSERHERLRAEAWRWMRLASENLTVPSCGTATPSSRAPRVLLPKPSGGRQTPSVPLPLRR